MKTFVRTFLAAILVFMSQYPSYSQTNPAKVNASESRILSGVILPLNETQTFGFVLPDKLQYWNREMKTIGEFTSLPNYPYYLKAKKAKKDQVADITFTIISSGIKSIEKAGTVNHPTGGKVVEFAYTFPCVLQVTDKDGKVLKNFELSSEDNVMTAIVHPAFLNAPQTGASNPEIPVVSSFKPTDVDKEVESKIKTYYARIEYNAYYKLLERALDIICRGYGYPKMTYLPVVLEVNKNEKSQFAELNGQIEKLKAGIAEIYSRPLNDDVKNRMTELGEYFGSKYSADSPKSVIQLYAFNSAMAYLMGGASDEAYAQYRAALPTFGMISTSVTVFEELYPVMTDMYNLYSTKDELNVVDLPILTIEDHKNIEKQALISARQMADDARRQELMAHNVSDAPGYVVTNNGEKIEGVVSMKFVELAPTQIADTDIAKLVLIQTGDGGKRTFRTNAVSHVMAGDRRFEPVTVSAGAAIKVLSAMSGNIGSNYFMEVVYKNGNCTAYIDPSVTSTEAYYVKSREDGKVEAYNVILSGNKASGKFLDDVSSELLTRVKAKEFAPTKEGLILFVDALAGYAK